MRRDNLKGVKSVVVSQLESGDLVELRTSNSVYRFWVEFADQSIGVAVGGSLRGPSRVRIAAEHATSGDAAVRPIRVHEKVQITILGPDGAPMRRFITSQIESIAVQPNHRAAA